MSKSEPFGAGAGIDSLARGAMQVIVRKATTRGSAPAATGTAAGGVALFAGGVAVGVVGALLLPRSRRKDWQRHADRALRIAGDIGLALANEAVRTAQDRATIDITPAAASGQTKRGGFAGAAWRMLGKR